MCIRDSLKDLKTFYDDIVYISYLTVKPDRDELNSYIEKMVEEFNMEDVNKAIKHLEDGKARFRVVLKA